MTFTTWLKRFEKDDTPYGDLARDIRDDTSLDGNRFNTRTAIRRHLENVGACREAIRTFEHAWVDYQFDIEEET